MRVLAFVALLLAATQANAANLPTLTAAGDDGNVALSLDAVRIDVLIRGHLARTTYELTYRNDLDRDLDGEFTFPLPVDAEISRLGLYFNGRLREAVAADRVEARAAYDTVVHRRVDPAIAEWSASSRGFRFRVYPIPARGTKTVHIAYDQELTSAPYELDLRYGATLAKFDIHVDSDVPVETEGIRLLRSGMTSGLQQEAMPLDATLRAQRQERTPAFQAWSAEDRSWYFAAATRLRSRAADVERASHVLLLVDVSSSGEQRDHAKLRAFLGAFLARQRDDVRVTVLPFHIGVDAPLQTNAIGLESALAALPYGGATNLAAMLDHVAGAPKDARVVIVTDGVNTISATARVTAAIEKLQRRVTVVNASQSADDHVLSSIATKSGGWLIDLTRDDPAAAADAAMRVPAIAAIRAAVPTVRDTLPHTIAVTGDASISVSARSSLRMHAFPLLVGNARFDLPLRELDTEAERDLVRRAWARAKLRALLDRGGNADAIREHGRRFVQLTPHTSLIVLDSWRDYEEHGFPLPKDLAEERDAENTRQRIRKATAAPPDRAGSFLRGTVTADGYPLPGATVTLLVDDQPRSVTVSNAEGHFWLSAARTPRSFTIRAELAGLNTVVFAFPHGIARGRAIAIPMRVSSVTESITVSAEAPAFVDATEVAVSGANLQPHLRDLPNPAFRIAARPSVGAEKSSLIASALALFEEESELAVRALTELAEAYADHAPTLRLLGRILDGWGRGDLSRLLFERALELAPREPQTARELELLDEKERTGSDARVLANSELQIDVMWDSNFTDVDLHVLQPDGEEVAYNHTASKRGGQLHRDIRDGFGPEIYTLPSMDAGEYAIALTYYASDDTQLRASTIAHVIVHVRGERRDYVVPLTKAKERVVVAQVTR